jgi:DNA replication protein DnaC
MSRRARCGGSLRPEILKSKRTLALCVEHVVCSDFDFAFQPSVERSRIETLATGAWVRASETLLIQGPPGVGK